MIHFNTHEIGDLKLWQYLEESSLLYNIEDIPNIAFTTLGLVAQSPHYGPKGIKLYASYTNEDNTSEIIRKTFTYYKNDPIKGTGLEIHFDWFTNELIPELDENLDIVEIDGVQQTTSIAIRKTEFKPLSIVEMTNMEVKNRERIITYLQASAIKTPIEFYVGEIFTHYQNFPQTTTGVQNPVDEYISIQGDLLTKFIKNGGWDFKWAVENETNPKILAYLNIVIAAPTAEYPTGKKVIDGILEQL